MITNHNPSTVLGIYYFAGMEGSVIFTPILGHFIDGYGLSASFGVAYIVLFAATILWTSFLWCSYHSE